MEIQFTTNVPDSTYFRVGDVEPKLNNNVLTVINGKGSKRYWGQPGVTTTIVLNDGDLVSVHIGFYHKHGGSQFWRHYKNGSKVDWKSLDDIDRLRILDCSYPNWANIPGKLKTQYLKNTKKVETDNAGNIIAYKYLANENGIFVSPTLSGKSAMWCDNHLAADRVPSENNSNGIYCAKTHNSSILNGYSKYKNVKLVKLMLCGITIEFDYGYRAEEAYILEVLS